MATDDLPRSVYFSGDLFDLLERNKDVADNADHKKNRQDKSQTKE